MSHLDATALLSDGKFYRLLSESETLFINEADEGTFGSWAGTNASLVAEETFRFRDVYNSLRIQPLVAANGALGNTEFSIAHDLKVIPDQIDYDKLIFHVFVYPMTEMQVSITIEDSNGLSTSTEYVDIPPLTWTLIKSAELAVTLQTATLRAFTTVNFRSDSSLLHAHIAHPIFTNSYGFTENEFLRECVTFMPRFLVETDEAQENPKFPMFRYMDVGLAYADRAYKQAKEFAYKDIASGFDTFDNSTRSTLVDPIVAEPEYLSWLGQFVGITRKSARSGATPWGNLPGVWDDIHLSIDPDADITYSISSINVSGATLSSTPSSLSEGDTVSITGTTNFNGQFLITSIVGNQIVLDPAISEADEYTGTVTLVDNSWVEIESYNTQDSNYIEAQRNLITSARTGHNAGTKQAIIDTLEEILLGTKTYSYSVDPFASPWVISIQTLTTETPGGATGFASQLILDQLANVKPMGFIIEHECTDSFLAYEEALLPYDSGAPYDGYNI